MNSSDLLLKVYTFFKEKTNSIISNDLLNILPSSGAVIDQLKDIGLLSLSGEMLHLGEQVEPVCDQGQLVDLLIAGKALLNVEIKQKQIALTPVSEDSFDITLGHRLYKLIGIEKSIKLKATIRLEVADKFHIDTLNFYQSANRNKLIQEICQTFHFPVGEIQSDIKTIVETMESYQYFEPSVIGSQTMSDNHKATAMTFGKNPDLIDLILKDYERLGSIGEESNKLLCYLSSVSRLLPRPLSVMVISSSGAGKSDLVTKTLNFLPPEIVIQLTSLSAKALFYKDEYSLKEKVLSLEEDAGAEAASYAIRQLISSSSLTVEATIRDQLDGKIKTQHNKVECQTVVFVTSTNPDTDPETKSRFLIMHVDESEEQTQRIIELQKKSKSLKALKATANKQGILNKHRNLHRLLKAYNIVNPFVDQLSLKDCYLSARRNFPKYLALIDSICLLRQFQKEVKTYSGVEYLEVDQVDLDLAKILFDHVINNSISELNIHTRELLTVLKKSFPNQTFTRRQIRELTKWKHTKVQRCMTQLLKYEHVILETGGFGKIHEYQLV